MIFLDSTKKYVFSKRQNKAEFKNPDDSVKSLVVIFQALEPLQPH